MKREFGVEGLRLASCRSPIAKPSGRSSSPRASSSSSRAARPYGHVWLKPEPQALGKGYDSSTPSRAAVPKEYIPAVAKGVTGSDARRRARRLSGRRREGALFDGSTTRSTRTRTRSRWRRSSPSRTACARRIPCSARADHGGREVETPEEKMGDVIGDLSGCRGVIQGMEDMPGSKAIRARCRSARCSATPRRCAR